jgi:hypothetical protein
VSELRAAASATDVRVTSLAYGADGVLSSMSWPALAAATTANFGYDNAGRVVSEGPDGFAATYAYDRDMLQSVTTPTSQVHTFDWSVLGQNAGYQPPGAGATQISYTPGRKLDRIQFPSGRFMDYQYGAQASVAGKLASLDTELGSYTYGYDEATGQLNDAKMPDGVDTFIETFTQ